MNLNGESGEEMPYFYDLHNLSKQFSCIKSLAHCQKNVTLCIFQQLNILLIIYPLTSPVNPIRPCPVLFYLRFPSCEHCALTRPHTAFPTFIKFLPVSYVYPTPPLRPLSERKIRPFKILIYFSQPEAEGSPLR